MSRARLLFVLGHRDEAETLARASLDAFWSAMNYLEGVPDFEVAHFRLDEAGRWIRLAFRCEIPSSADGYHRTCPADLAHLRVGLSPGMRNVVALCTVCGLDCRLCRHVSGRPYLAEVRSVAGDCNVCGEEAGQCEHLPGTIYEVECARAIISFEVDETSVVYRPAQPMARIISTSIRPGSVPSAFRSGGPLAGNPLPCNRCLNGCRGVVEEEAAFQELGPQNEGFVALYRQDPCPPQEGRTPGGVRMSFKLTGRSRGSAAIGVSTGASFQMPPGD